MNSWPAADARTELTNADLKNLKAQLREQRDFRLNQLAELANDAGDGNAATARLEVIDVLENAARHALAEIDLALDRLRCGRYGRCVDCGEAVGHERLEVLPAAARCMPCQRRVDDGRPLRRPHATHRSKAVARQADRPPSPSVHRTADRRLGPNEGSCRDRQPGGPQHGRRWIRDPDVPD